MTGIDRNLSSVPRVAGRRRGSWSYPPGVDALRDAWRAEAGRTGWSRPRDWWVPEIDALAGALCAGPGDTGAGALPACAKLGQVRAEAGVGLTEALDDLCAVFRVIPAGSPPLPAVRAFVEAWTDVWLRDMSSARCVDPLTELTSPAYLRTRLSELYRNGEVAGHRVAERHALLVVATDASAESGWRLLVRQLAVAELLRVAFPGGETLTALSPRRVVALVDRGTGMLDALGMFRARLTERLGTGAARTWLSRLPDRATDVAALLTELTDD